MTDNIKPTRRRLTRRAERERDERIRRFTERHPLWTQTEISTHFWEKYHVTQTQVSRIIRAGKLENNSSLPHYDDIGRQVE